jgi:uncharacterized protein (TIGR02246 family)
MKRSIIVLALLTLVGTFAVGQMKRNDSDEAQIVALEKMAFEAWKNKDRKFFEDHMSEAGQYLDLNGVGGKTQYVKAIIDNNCTVSKYSLDNTKVTILSKDVALLTYRYAHDAVCEGNPEASPLWASTVYVNRGGKWLIAFHQEIPAAPAK